MIHYNTQTSVISADVRALAVNCRQGKSTIVIIMTASMIEDDDTIMQQTGCDAVIRKPMSESCIFSLLVQHLGVEFIHDDGDRHRTTLFPEHAYPTDTGTATQGKDSSMPTQTDVPYLK